VPGAARRFDARPGPALPARRSGFERRAVLRYRIGFTQEQHAVPKKTTPFNFEQSLKDLERLVEELEKGELGLEESLEQFERGIALTRDCQQALAAAEQKVRLLSETSGQLEPFTGPKDAIPDDA